ncbi:MAG: DUF167 domain-containing protein [Patescibacteria group bacterium]
MLEKLIKELNKKKEIYLEVKVRPNANITGIKEIMDNRTVKIDIAAPPIKDKANQELIKYLAKEFGVIKNNVKIISGSKEKVKLIKLVK